MFPLWFTLLGGSFVFLNIGLTIFFLVFPFFGCFGLFMIAKVSLVVHRCSVITICLQNHLSFVCCLVMIMLFSNLLIEFGN
jgi:hypothetical protein